MKSIKPLHIILSSYVLYLVIVFSIVLKKPDGWSFMPYAWQQAWHPSYLLLIFLILLGAAISYFAYKLIKQKEQKK